MIVRSPRHFYEPALWHVPESALQWRHHNAQTIELHPTSIFCGRCRKR
jgi:hypothetical protein